MEGFPFGEHFHPSGEQEFSRMKGALQAGDKLAAKHRPSTLTGRKKA